LNGLIEKFQVLNNDLLAEALAQRLEELDPESTKWTPEILSLLLLLSDEPLRKSKVETLETLYQHDAEPELTWDEIIAEDPLEADGVWDEVDFRAGSEDEDTTLLSLASSHTSDDTRSSSIDDDQSGIAAEAFVLPIHFDALEEMVLQAKQQRGVTEVRLVRETLHMLLGLPTAIYETDENDRAIRAHSSIMLESLSKTALDSLLQSFASMGTDVGILRNYSKAKHDSSLLQTFAAAIDEQLQDFGTSIARIETSFVNMNESLVVSLITVESEVRNLVAHLSYLNQVIKVMHGMPSAQSFRLLDELYNHVCMAEIIGDSEGFFRTSRLFSSCLHTYLKPLGTWMDDGDLGLSSAASPFISRGNVGISNFWNDRYVLARDKDGLSTGPGFLQSLMPQIFASGKSVSFMRELGLSVTLEQLPSGTDGSIPDFSIKHAADQQFSLTSFPQLLHSRLEAWVSSKHQHTWRTLSQHLQRRGGVTDTMEALEYLYLSKDGSLTNQCASAVFAKLDAGTATWHEPLFLEDLLRSCFASHAGVDKRRISIARITESKPIDSSRRDRTVKALGIVPESIAYSIPAHIHNIIPPKTAMPIYIAISAILLQLYRPIYLLSLRSLKHSHTSHHAQQVRDRLTLRLRHRLLHTLTSIRSHLLYEVIAPSSRTLHSAVMSATSIHGLIAAHATYMARLERGCLLSLQVLGVRGAILSLADLGVVFAQLQTRLQNGFGAKASKDTHDDADDISSDSEHDTGDEAKDEKASAPPARILTAAEGAARTAQIASQHDQLLGFVVAGLRTAARGATTREGTGEGLESGKAGEASWGVLAEVLEWGL